MGMCDRLFQQTTDPQVATGLRVIHMAAQALADEFNSKRLTNTPLRRASFERMS